MILRILLKTSSLIILLSSLSGCESPFLTAKKPELATTTTENIATTKPNTPLSHPDTWEESYGTPQESQQNTLPLESIPFKKPKLVAEPATDVWQRIRNGLSISSDTIHPDTEKYITWFGTHPEYISRMVERARPYLYHIVSELEKRDMPLEIALLPVVESGFKPFAYSSGNASGIWQFIPGTGKVYGLEQNWWYDGRRDIIDSSRAAMDYLQKLYNDFGDWQLALAAYNCGEGTVGRAIKKNIEANKPTDFWSLDLPKETSAYVPKLMAVAEFVKHPAKYNISLSPIDNKPYLTTVEVGSQIDIAIAAKLADLTTDEMYQLNPAFNQWATPPDGPHRLVIPIEKENQFKTALRQLPVKERIQWQRHKIKQGESLSVIAQKYNTTINTIKVSNDLNSNALRAGKYLLIPTTSERNKTSELAEKKPTTNNKKTPKKGNKQVHIVKSGDTWWDLAAAYDVDVHKLTKWNNKSPNDTLQIGQQLTIWKKHNSKEKNKSTHYTIQDGDSLWKIARQFNVSVQELREWNNLSPRTLIKPGQKLTLFADNS